MESPVDQPDAPDLSNDRQLSPDRGLIPCAMEVESGDGLLAVRSGLLPRAGKGQHGPATRDLLLNDGPTAGGITVLNGQRMIEDVQDAHDLGRLYPKRPSRL